MDDQHGGGNSVPFKSYVDGQLTEVRRAVDLALASVHTTEVPLREFIEAILEEQRRGMIVAAEERQKAAQTLAEEREKTAQALAVAIGDKITLGDDALRDHIQNQVTQVREALAAARALSDQQNQATQARLTEAVARSLERLQGVQREIALITNSAALAIAKAEASTEKRFESVNEFRAQLTDQSTRFMPREVADAQFEEMRRSIADLAEKVGKLV